MVAPKLQKILEAARGMRAKGKSATETLAYLNKKLPEPAELPPGLRAEYSMFLLDAGREADALRMATEVMNSEGPGGVGERVRSWLEENLPSFRHRSAVLDACWMHRARSGDWDGARKLVKTVAAEAPDAIGGFRKAVFKRAQSESMAPFLHAALAQISLAEHQGGEAVQQLRSALHGTPELRAFATSAIAQLARANPDRLDIRWALLEAGGLEDPDWVEKAMELAAQDPNRMVLYLKDSVPRSSAGSREGLEALAVEMTRRFPSLPGAWEALAGLKADDPHAEVAARVAIVRLEPGEEAARAALERIHEIADEAPGDMRRQFARIRALLHMTEYAEVRSEMEPLARVDPGDCLAVLAEARSSGSELPEDFLILEAGCLHRLGRDAEAADRIRQAVKTPALVRVEALTAMRADSPASPDLACALAEVCVLNGDLDQAERILGGLVEQAPGSAASVLAWLDGPAAGALCDEARSRTLRAQAELACGKAGPAIARIADLLAEDEPRGRDLLGIAARQRVAAPSDTEMDLEVLRLLADTGLDAGISLRLLRRLHATGEAEQVLEMLGSRVPRDAATEREWLFTLARLNLDLDRPRDAVGIARTATSTSLALEVLDAVLDDVKADERWIVLEGRAETLLDSGAGVEQILPVIGRVLEEHPERVEAVHALLAQCPDEGPTRAERRLLSGRCELGLLRHDAAAESFLSAARTASEGGKEGLTIEARDLLASLVEEQPSREVPRLCLSRAGTIAGDADASLAPIREAPEPSTALLSRLDEIHVEFPGTFDALRTSVDWYRGLGAHAEAVERLRRLLAASAENAERVRAAAEEVHEESRLVTALEVVAAAERKLGLAEEELSTCRRILDLDPHAYPSVKDRLVSLHSRQSDSVDILRTSIEAAVGAADVDGLLEASARALAAPLSAEGAAAVAEALKDGAALEAASTRETFWSHLADLHLRAGSAPESVEASRKQVDAGGDPEGAVEERLLALREAGGLPATGLDLLIERRRDTGRADHLAEAIRWRLEAGGVDAALRRSLLETGASLTEEGGGSVELLMVIEELCTDLGDAPGALAHLAANVDGLGSKKTLERLGDLADRFPEEAEIPLLRAVRVLAPGGRAREAALDVERALGLDPDAALEKGLPCAQGLLEDHEREPELLRVLARLGLAAGDGPGTLDMLNRLESLGDEPRSRALGLFPELAERFPTCTEGRIRWAEVLAAAAEAEPDRAPEHWEQCDRRCREVLSGSVGTEEELRTTKLLATALERRWDFEAAAGLLGECREKYPDESELLVRLRGNHLRHMDHVVETAGDGTTRALAHLRVGRPREALLALEEAEGEDPEIAAVRAWAHYAAGHHDRAVEECAALVLDLPPSGRLEDPYPEILYFMGRACIRVGEEARGIGFLERLARDHPCHRACRAFLLERTRRREACEERDLELTSSLEELSHGQA